MPRKIINRLGSQDTYSLPLGGPGSGHHGHSGRPGLRGGSLPSGGAWVESRMDLGKTVSVKKPTEKPGVALRRSLKVVEKSLYQRHEDGDMDEYCYVLTPGGAPVFDKEGHGVELRFTLAEHAMVKDNIFTHSHPLGWKYATGNPMSGGNSFSIEDIRMAMLVDVAEIRAVSRSYVHRIVRPKEGWGDTEENMWLIRSANLDVSSRLQHAVNVEMISPEMANSKHYHELWLRVSRDLGWEYERVRYRDYIRETL